ncbi:hypothetical protein ACVWZ4_001036 [Bradyrhizobium sp. USDA 4472]
MPAAIWGSIIIRTVTRFPIGVRMPASMPFSSPPWPFRAVRSSWLTIRDADGVWLKKSKAGAPALGGSVAGLADQTQPEWVDGLHPIHSFMSQNLFQHAF